MHKLRLGRQLYWYRHDAVTKETWGTKNGIDTSFTITNMAEQVISHFTLEVSEHI